MTTRSRFDGCLRSPAWGGALILSAWLLFGGLSRAAEAPEIRWTEASSGTIEVPLGGGFDLDFQSTLASEFDAQFEPWEGGSFWAPKRGCSVAILGVKDFTSLDMESAHAAPRSPSRVYLCGGTAEPVTAGTVIIASTSDARFSKVLVDSCSDTLKLRYVTYNREVIQPKLAPVAGLEAPHILVPPDGVEFEHDPRDLLLAWSSVRGASTYTVELDCRGCCGPRKELFCAEQENGHVFKTLPGLTTPAYYTLWLGPYPGRWRVRAVQPDPGGEKAGPWSPWTAFRFKK